MKTRFLIRRAALAGALLLSLPLAALAADQAELIRSLKPKVVNVSVSVTEGLAEDSPGSWFGTGFIVDAERGLIATNRHVSTRSPAQYKVSFANGFSTTRVRLKYYDPWHDFAFLEVDKKSLEGTPFEAVTLGESLSLQEQQKVFLIGNDDGQEYTVLYGEVINKAVNAGDRHSDSVQVAYPSQGGSSGSPVFDEQGRVVAIHYKGTANTGLELRIEYLKDALARIASGKFTCRRGEIGCKLDLMRIPDAQKYFHLPKVAAERIQRRVEGLKNVICVSGVIPCGPAEGQLQPGDIIESVDGAPVANSLYQFDKAVDARMGQRVKLGIIRNGAAREVELEVRDAEENRVKRFAQFAGGIIHDLTPEIRRTYAISAKGVFLNQVQKGSSLDQIDAGKNKDKPERRWIVIEAVNGVPTPDLSAFIAQASKLKHGDDINLTLRDYMASSVGSQAVPLSLGLQFHPLKVLQLGEGGEWTEVRLNPGTGK